MDIEQFIKAKYNLEFTAGDDHIYIEYLEKELKAAWELNTKLVQLKFIGECFKMLNFLKEQLPPNQENNLSGIIQENKTMDLDKLELHTDPRPSDNLTLVDIDEYNSLIEERKQFSRQLDTFEAVNQELSKMNDQLTAENKELKITSEWYLSLRKSFEDLLEENKKLQGTDYVLDLAESNKYLKEENKKLKQENAYNMAQDNYKIAHIEEMKKELFIENEKLKEENRDLKYENKMLKKELIQSYEDRGKFVPPGWNEWVRYRIRELL